MLTPSGLLVGFAFKAFAADETTLYVVNVCGHDSVGLPLARSMNTVDESYVEHNGVDNLIIPISVSEPRRASKGDFAFCIDVVVHTMLIEKCTPAHHLYRHLTEKLLVLAMEWVQTECGVQLLRQGCCVLSNPFYYSDVQKEEKSMDRVMKMAAELLKAQTEASSTEENKNSTFLPNELNLKNDTSKGTKKPLIQEVIASPGLKKGFLNNKNTRLYGPEGSAEGTGKTPDPLAHIPESLRNKCRIIDTRALDQTPSATSDAQHVPAAVKTEATESQATAASPSAAVRGSAAFKALSFDQAAGKLMVRFAVPEEFTSLRDVDLSATANTLEIDGAVTQLPVCIDADGVRAKFVKASRTLVVTCPTNV